MKLSKKIVSFVLAIFMLASCFVFAGCQISNDYLIKNFEGTYKYKSAVDTINNVDYDYQKGGELKLYISNGKAAFKNNAASPKNFVYDLETSILGSSLKLLGEGYYYNGDTATRADYIFGSGYLDGSNLVLKLMFVDYSKSGEATELKCALTITFEKQ